jgi:hypothetical protein
MPNTRKPGRPRKDEIEDRIAIYTKHDEQIQQEHDTWLEIDISTPTLPDQVMKIDKVDYEALKTALAGRFIARISATFDNQPIAFVHPRNKEGTFNSNPNYVHNLICKHRGFLWHRNTDQLDNRRANLETNLPIQESTVGKPSADKTYTNLTVDELLADFEAMPKKPTVFPPKPMPELKPYDPNAKHEMIDLLTGKPEAIENNENQKG